MRIVFYDPDIDEECKVTCIEVIGQEKLIVAIVKKMKADSSAYENEEKQLVRAADIQSLLGTYHEERTNGEVNSKTEGRPGDLEENHD